MVNSETDIKNVELSAPGVARLLVLMVNVYFLKSNEGKGSEWVLIDAGIGNCMFPFSGKATEL
ncbi:hypothetical protein BH23BAC1_BH23BAC1_39750 [soil metagenome]